MGYRQPLKRGGQLGLTPANGGGACAADVQQTGRARGRGSVHVQRVHRAW